MVRKREHPKLEDLTERPWCYYCERDFDDNRVLISHQKAKHFRCIHCSRRLNTAGGLAVHLQQVHKETLHKIDQAIPGREGVTPEIFGMCGVPEDLLYERKQRIMNQYFKLEAERRARTGNPPPGTVTGSEPRAKRAKTETPEELKARLAEHRAKRAAMRNSQGQTDASTSAPTPGSISPTTTPDPLADLRAGWPSLQRPSGVDPTTQFPPQHSGHWPQHMSHTYSPSQGHPQFSVPPYIPPVQYGQIMGQNPAPTNRPTSRATYETRRPSYGAPNPYTLPSAPGLPARPTFEAPILNREEMSRMHTGQAPPPGGAAHRTRDDGRALQVGETATNASAETSAQASVNQDSANQIFTSASSALGAPEQTAPAKKKKNKTSNFNLVYNDNSESPEEKRAKSSKYAFKRDNGQ